MLENLDGRRMTGVPHRDDFDPLLRRLGAPTAAAIREYLDGVIDTLPAAANGLRTFSSSQLGSNLSPWPDPLGRLYVESRAFLGTGAAEDDVQDRAALWFGLFVWERIVGREELWVFYDPNLGPTDPNREPMGKVYFERAA